MNRPTAIASVAAAATCAAILAGGELPATSDPVHDLPALSQGPYPKIETLALYTCAREEAVADVVAGRRTVPEAAALCRAINHLPDGPGLRVLELSPPGATEAEVLCRRVIKRAQALAAGRGGPAGDGLEQQVWDVTDGAGVPRLPGVREADLADLLDRAHRRAAAPLSGARAAWGTGAAVE